MIHAAWLATKCSPVSICLSAADEAVHLKETPWYLNPENDPLRLAVNSFLDLD